MNVLPNRGLDRIEVLRDGASSIYGTDAVAGVINTITQRNFAGTELVLRYGETEDGDGREVRATLTHGLKFHNGRGRAMVVLDLYDRDPIYARDRAFSAEADHSARAPAPGMCPRTPPSTPALPQASSATSSWARSPTACSRQGARPAFPRRSPQPAGSSTWYRPQPAWVSRLPALPAQESPARIIGTTTPIA
ncbi:MAG: TonB-dependent receptor plug domain-containing protein [Opitutaceae bacterium]|nr:TonB-dependent receptor plug domain-containing protein [Opitutaceae bacterium]